MFVLNTSIPFDSLRIKCAHIHWRRNNNYIMSVNNQTRVSQRKKRTRKREALEKNRSNETCKSSPCACFSRSTHVLSLWVNEQQSQILASFLSHLTNISLQSFKITIDNLFDECLPIRSIEDENSKQTKNLLSLLDGDDKVTVLISQQW